MKKVISEIGLGLVVCVCGITMMLVAIEISDAVDRENYKKMQDCIKKTDGTDADCEQCFFEVYGVTPN